MLKDNFLMGEVRRKFRLLKIASVILLISFAVRVFFSWNPQLAISLYKDGFFAAIRVIYDNVIGQWLPIPFILIAFVLLTCSLIYSLYKKRTFVQKLSVGAAYFFLIISAFLMLWGYNYSVPSVSKLVGIQYEKVDSTQLFLEMERVVGVINDLRTELQDDSLALQLTTENVEADIRADLSKSLNMLGIKTAGKPRVRTLEPKGILMRWKTAGIYIPHAFEGHIDGGLLAIEHPFTIAHEMSHAYGIAGEGDCNFTAFIACSTSENLYFQYSAYVDYSIYLLRDVYRTNKVIHKEIYSSLHPGFKADIKALVENGKKYPDILPAIRDLFYDNYLKSQGIPDGIKNYSRIINMVINYNAQFSTDTQ